MKRKRKQKCIPGLGAARSSHLRKRVRDDRDFEAQWFIDVARAIANGEHGGDNWPNAPIVQAVRARYNRARALAAECGV